MEYFEIFFTILFALVTIYYLFHEKNGMPSNWPIVGMLPALLKNCHRIHDFFTEVTEKTKLTFLIKGPWFTNMHLLATVDPANVQHIMNKNFANYPKGSKYNEIFDVFGDGLLNTDHSTVVEYHRKMFQSFFGHPKFFDEILLKKVTEKVENGLIAVLDNVCKKGIEVDLQDVFARFTFDIICSILMDYDPVSLSIDMPIIPFSNALDTIEETVFYRHLIPSCVWKLQRWLSVGQEKKHKVGCKIVDAFLYEWIAIKRDNMDKELLSNPKIENEARDFMTLYMEDNEIKDDFIRDTFLSFIIAGRDTTSTTLSWLFYLLTMNPRVVSRIREELHDVSNEANRRQSSKPSKDFYRKLVYLHAALCETLRLYPPVVFEAKSPIETDTLPSGHQVKPNMQILINLYAMGRMKSIWGDDCCEFKPERWISGKGKIKHEPSYKFLAFNAGPRACLGRDMAFIQMKAVAAAVILNYNIQRVEGSILIPGLSIILHMKHGFKVKVVPLQHV